MKEAELNRKIDIAARKRDHAVDVLNKPILGWTYQLEIEKLLKQLEELKNGR